MNTYSLRSLGLSTLLHGVAAFAVWYVFKAATSMPLSAPTVFTFVMSSDSALSNNQRLVGPELIRFSMAEQSVREAHEAPPDRTAVAPVPNHQPAVKPAPRPTLSIDEFRSRHPLSRSAGQASARVITKISESYPLESKQGSATSSRGSHELNFVPALLAELRAVFGRAGTFSPGMQTTVEFTLRKDGALVGTRILQSSGLREFDEAVLAAIGEVCAKKFSSTAVGERYVLAFRATDE